MGITKTINLKMGDDSFVITAKYSETNSNPNFSVKYFKAESKEEFQDLVSINSNKEIVELLKKINDFRYWNIVQFEADVSELTELINKLFNSSTEENSNSKQI